MCKTSVNTARRMKFITIPFGKFYLGKCLVFIDESHMLFRNVLYGRVPRFLLLQNVVQIVHMRL